MGGGIKALLKAGASWLVKRGAQQAVKSYGDDIFRAGVRRVAPRLESSVARSAGNQAAESAAARIAKQNAIRRAEEEAKRAAARRALLNRPVEVAKRYTRGKANDAITLGKNAKNDITLLKSPKNWKPTEGPLKSFRKSLGINDTIKVRRAGDLRGRSGEMISLQDSVKRGLRKGGGAGLSIYGSALAVAPDKSDFLAATPGAALEVASNLPIVSDAIKFTRDNPDASAADILKESGRIGFQYTPGYGTARTGGRVVAQFQKDGAVTIPGVGEVKSLSRAVKEDGTLMALFDAGLDLLDVAEVSTFLKPQTKQAIDEALGLVRGSKNAPKPSSAIQLAETAPTPTAAKKAAELEANQLQLAPQGPAAQQAAPIGLADPAAPIIPAARPQVTTTTGRTAQDLVAAAEVQAPKYLGDVKSTADEVGAAYLPEFEKNAIKRNTDRINEKILAKGGAAPTDILRSTLLVNDPADAGRIIDNMQAKGYQVWNNPETGAPDIDDLYAAGAEGYKHVAVKFTTGPDDDVVKELLVMTPQMFKAKKTLGGHDIYDVTRALDGLISDATPPELRAAAEQSIGTLDGLSKRLYAAAEAPASSTSLPTTMSELISSSPIDTPKLSALEMSSLRSNLNVLSDPASANLRLSDDIADTYSGVIDKFAIETPSSSIIPQNTSVRQADDAIQLTRDDELLQLNEAVTGDKSRGLTKTIQNAEGVDPELAGRVRGTYTAVTNEQSAKAAQKRIQSALKSETSIDEVETYVLANTDAEAAATGSALIKHYQSQGQFEKAGQLADDLAIKYTEAGQFVQAARMYQDLTPEAIVQATANKINRLKNQFPNIKGVQSLKTSPNFQEEVIRRMDEIKGMKGTDPASVEMKNLKTYELQQYVGRQIPNTFAQKASSIYKANLLTAVTTSLGAVMGNTGRLSLKLASDAVATALDTATSMLTGTARERAFTLRGLIDGSEEGIRKARTFLKTGYDPRNPLNKFDTKQVFFSDSKSGRAAETYVNAVFRTMGALDQPFYYAAFKNDIYQQAMVAGRNQKLGGKKFAEFVENYVDNPPDEALDFANRAARDAVFQNDTRLGNIAGNLKSSWASDRSAGGQAGALAMESILPFTKIPAAVAMSSWEFSPGGAIGEIVKQAIQRKLVKKDLIDALAKSTVGTGGVMTMGSILEENGMITLGYPTDQKERDLWELEGKQPYSINIDGNWRSLNYVQPFGALMAAGAAYNREDGGFGDKAAGAAREVASSLLEQSFVEGVKNAIEVVTTSVEDKDGSASQLTKYIGRQAGAVIPNIVRRFASAIDPAGNRVTDGDGVLDTIIKNVQAGVPFWRNELIAKRNVFGDTLEKRESFVDSMFDPTRPKSATDNDPLTNELRRLQDAEQGVLPSRFKGKQDIFGTEIKLTPEQQEGLERLANPEVQKAWNEIIKTSQYQSADDKEKSNMLAKAASDIRAVAKLQFAEDEGLQLDPEKVKKMSKTEKAYALSGEYTINSLLGLPEGMTEQSRDIIMQVEKMASSDKEAFFDQGENEYLYELAKFEKNDLEGELSEPQKFEKLLNLGKLKVQTQYSRDSRDLYKLSKRELEAFLEQSPQPAELVEEMLRMDQELAAKGFISKPKFAGGIGGGGGKGGGKGGRGGKSKAPKIPLPTFGSFGLVGDPPKNPTANLSDVLRDYEELIGSLSSFALKVPAESSSEIEIRI